MAKTIVDLPEEMLIEVFEYLDGKSVKEAALVCKEWSRVVGTTPAIMKKFVLNIKDFSLYPRYIKKFRDIMSLGRQFTSLRFSVENKAGERYLVRLFERHGGSFLDVCLVYHWKSTSHDLLQILRSVPKLESLECYISGRLTDMPSAGNNLKTVTLEKLKKVVAERSADILQLIHAPMLEDLAIIPLGFHSDTRGCENLLKASPKLESLWMDLDAFEEMDPVFPFRLKKLVGVGDCEKLTDNVKKFLLSQAATVEELYAVCCTNAEFLEIVLTKFRRLRTLHTNFGTLAAPQKFYDELEPMTTLKELSLPCGIFSSESAMKAVLGNCPNLEKLSSHYCRILANYLDFVAAHNTNLKSLEILNMTATNARFKFLKHLCLYEINNGDVLLVFLKSNPTIETFKTRSLAKGVFSGDNVTALVTETGLKHLEFNGSGSAEVYEKINEFEVCKTLLSEKLSEKKLEVHISRETGDKATKRKRSPSP